MNFLKNLLIIFILLIINSPIYSNNLKKIMVILPVGNINNNGFISTSYEGIIKERKNKNILIDVFQPGSSLNFENSLIMAANSDYNLIVGVGFPITNDMKKIAKKFPKKRFAIIGSLIMEENVASYIFKDEEGAFLAGVIAALTTKNNKIGFIGGMKSYVMEKFQKGFIDGAQNINEDIEVISKYVDTTLDGFSNIPKCEKIANALCKKGIDVIYTAAGGSNFGAIKSSKKNKIYCIGVHPQKNSKYSNTILASVKKRVDMALKIVVEDELKGNSQGIVTYIGLLENGYNVIFSENIKIIKEKKIEEKVEFYKKEIISGLEINLE